MVSNFGVSFKLRDTREVPEPCIASWRRCGKVRLPQGERPNDHRLFQNPLSSNGRHKKPFGCLSVTHPIGNAKEQQALAVIRQASPTADTVYALAQDFMQMLRRRQGQRLDVWLDQVRASHIPELQRFVRSIQRDKDAVLAGLTEPWSNGVVEGNSNKLKLIKRMMFGRAGFALLRQRVLHAL